MPVEIRIAAFGALLLMIHVGIAGQLRTAQYGSRWNASARDEAMPPLNPLAARMVRAQANFQETFPIAIVALLGVVLAGRTSHWTATGGWTWLAARVAYVPLYAAGVPYVRSVVFLVSLIGLGLAIWPLLAG